MLKKILKITAIIFIVLLLALFSIPFLFKGKIIELVKNEANKSLNATLQFEDLSLSVFRHFPQLSIELKQLSIANKAPFQGDTLLKMGALGITTNIMSIIKGDAIEVKRVWLESGDVFVKVLKDGTANYDIMLQDDSLETTAETESKAFLVKLQGYSFKNINVRYEDDAMKLYTQITGLNHSGKGDFTAEKTTLETNTKIDQVDLSYEGVAYFSKLAVEYKADFDLDLKNSIYRFLENEAKLNALELTFEGQIAMPGDDMDVDIKFAALKNEVKHFISLIPGSFTQDFEHVKSSGNLAFDGFAKGVYTETSLPAFGFHLLIENGMIQYPDLPKGISNMQVNLGITNPGGSDDNTLVHLSRFHADFGDAPLDASLLLKTPVSDPDFDVRVAGKLKLQSFREMLPLEQSVKLQGLIDANFAAKGRMSDVEASRYEKVAASGSMLVSGFEYADAGMPESVKISNASLSFNPRSADLNNLQMNLGKSDIQAKGKLENYLGYMFSDSKLKGELSMTSTLLDVNPFMTSDTVNATTPGSTEAQEYVRIPDNIDFVVNSSISELRYDNMNMRNVKGQFLIRNEKLDLRNLYMEMLGGSLIVNGSYDSQFDAGPALAFDLKVKDFDIRETAKTFNTVKQLAPIAENTVGKVSVDMDFSSKADKDFNFDFASFHGAGKLSTSMIIIEGFEMVKKTAETLKIDKLKKWQMEKVNLSFVIREGKLFIEPFETKLGNYKATIGGYNGLDQQINYAINLDIPRAEFGGAANNVLNNMVAQAGNSGVNVNLGEIIPVTLTITGTFANPVIKTDLKQQAGNVLNDLKKQAEDKLREEAEIKKQEALDRANAEKEKLQKEAEERVKKETERLKSETDKAKQEAERRAKEEADKAKKKAEEEAKKGIKNLLNR